MEFHFICGIKTQSCKLGEFYEIDDSFSNYCENVVIKDKKNELLCILVKKAIDNDNLVHLGNKLKKAAMENFGRGDAGGKISKNLVPNFLKERILWTTGNDYEKHYLTKNGTISKRPHGNSAHTGVLGFVDRRHTGKQLSYWTKHLAAHMEDLKSVMQDVERAYALIASDHFQFQNIAVRATPYSFLDTCFTSVTINHNFRTAAHTDRNNMVFPACSVMLVIQLKPFTGMQLLLPEYKISLDVQHGDLLILNPKVVHCNNLKGDTKTEMGSRLSLVFYAKQTLINLHDQ